jgi:hypothetical protein
MRRLGRLLLQPNGQHFRALGLRKPHDDLEERSVRASLNLLLGLILYGMRHVYRVKVRAIQRRSLGPRSGLKLAGGDGHRGNSQIL